MINPLSRKVLQSESGAVALLTSVIIGILLTIIVTGLVGVMASELRQATDNEQSVIAYYAAQSGVEAKLQQIIGNINYADANCTSSALTSAVGWTCAKVTKSGSPEDNLQQPDQTVQIDLAGAPSFSTMVLSWNRDEPVDSNAYFDFDPASPPSSTNSKASPIELTVVGFQTADYNVGAGQDPQADITTQNLLLYPTSGAGTASIAFPLLNKNPTYAHCDKDVKPYHCSITVTGYDTSTRSYLLRLRTRYSGTAFKLDFYNSSGTRVDVPDGSATIDVTAKAGNVFRRVIYKVPITNGAASGLDYVLFSDNNVCKDYSIVAGDVNGYPCLLP